MSLRSLRKDCDTQELLTFNDKNLKCINRYIILTVKKQYAMPIF